MNPSIFRQKAFLKDLAASIRLGKFELKAAQRDGRGPDVIIHTAETFSRRCKYRREHVAYCLARGRSLEQVESRAKTKLDQSAVAEALRRLLGEEEGARIAALNFEGGSAS